MMPKIPRTINDGHKNVMADNEIVYSNHGMERQTARLEKDYRSLLALTDRPS